MTDTILNIDCSIIERRQYEDIDFDGVGAHGLCVRCSAGVTGLRLEGGHPRHEHAPSAGISEYRGNRVLADTQIIILDFIESNPIIITISL